MNWVAPSEKDTAATSLEQINTLENQMENLRRTRDLLLPRQLSGKVELKIT